MLYPYPPLPKDKNLNVMDLYPPNLPAKARTLLENGTVSSLYSVGHDTTIIEITTQGTAGIMRWVTLADTEGSVIGITGATGNYDHVIPPNAVRQFAIPIESYGAAQGSVQGANRLNGLYQRLAMKTQGIASIFLIQY